MIEWSHQARRWKMLRKKWFWAVVVLVVVVAVIGVAGCGGSPKATPTPEATPIPTWTPTPIPPTPTPTPPPGIGTKFTVGTWEVTPLRVERVQSLSGGFVGTVTAKGQYIIVFLKVKNIGTVSNNVGLSLFVLRDDLGRTFDMDGEASLSAYYAYNTPEWWADNIQPGLEGELPIAFDVSTDAKGFTFRVKGGGVIWFLGS